MACGGCGKRKDLPMKALPRPQEQPQAPPPTPRPYDSAEARRQRKAARKGIDFPEPVEQSQAPVLQAHDQQPPAVDKIREVHIRWPHGLGDTALMALVVPLYLRHGVQIVVDPTPYSSCLWERAGAVIRPGGVHHPYSHAPKGENKFKWNLGREPLPPLPGVDLWAEVQTMNLSLIDFVTEDGMKAADFLIGSKKVVVTHWHGHTLQDRKDVPQDVADQVGETLRAEGLEVIDVGGQYKPTLPTLWYLLSRAAAVVAIGSGVQLLASHWATSPVVGVWHGHTPEKFALPSKAVHLARAGGRSGEYRVTEYSGTLPSADLIVRTVLSVLK